MHLFFNSKWIGICISLLILSKLCESEEYCYSTDANRNQSRQYSTKTSYPKWPENYTMPKEQYTISNCSSVKIWLLNRHGTRLPSEKEIIQMQELTDIHNEIIANHEVNHLKKTIELRKKCPRNPNITKSFFTLFGASTDKESCSCANQRKAQKTDLCSSDIELLRNWKWNSNITKETASFLTKQGWNDIAVLARNFKKSFPHLFTTKFNKENYQFLHTKTQRNEESYKAFWNGIFEENYSNKIHSPFVPNREILLKPYEYCNITKAQSDQVEDGPDSEYRRFKLSPMFDQMIAEVSRRLGLTKQLSIRQLGLIWDMCRYDQSWQLDQPSAWCSAFAPTHTDILEYSEDLKYFYKSSHGSKLNRYLPCAIGQDLVAHMSSDQSPNVIAYFAHSTIIHLLLTTLDAIRDPIELRWNTFQESRNRIFKSSKNAPFAANLAIVKYQCESNEENIKIGIFLNEKPLQLEWCGSGQHICSLKNLREKFQEFTNCDKTFCRAQ